MSLESPYTQTTNFVKTTVLPVYLSHQSSPEDDQYFWAYHICIENLGRETIQLCTRHWIILDAYGYRQEIKGEGVVGEMPTLKPGESFEYTSGTPLSTASGIMMGYYEMKKLNGETFLVDIPAFSLDSPHQPVLLN
jgi:ApaG protein